MRIAIREQLAALVLVAVLVALAIVSIPVWIYVNNFVIRIETRGLTLTASLKAAQVSSEIEIIQTACNSITTRLLLQEAFITFYRGNDTEENWGQAALDLRSALNAGPGGSSNLLQARLYSRNETGDPRGLVSVTGAELPRIKLPYTAPNGSDIFVDDTELGYPPALYPNITYYDTNREDPFNPGGTVDAARPFPDIRIDSRTNGLVLGPLVLNETYALISYTLPIRQNNNESIVLGYMTVVAEATSIVNIMTSEEGLGETGSVLLIGPATGWNRFSRFNLPANRTHDAASNFSQVDVRFVLPPQPRPGQPDRHATHNFASGRFPQPFQAINYDAVYRAFTARNPEINNASSMLSTTNEEGIHVAVGYARPQTVLVNWTLIIEQDRAEAYVPINTLRNILLGCVFSTIGLILLLVLPIAHLSVMPIRRLKSATKKSIAPPGYEEAFMDDPYHEDDEGQYSTGVASPEQEKGLAGQLKRLARGKSRRQGAVSEHDSDPRRRRFKIPGKVSENRKHYVRDELTELTTTFNEMVDELTEQYTSLESKVAERTHELEQSKKAAEAANESKTLFIANISHELKTPLNGILGMCAVCMEEDDLVRIKQSLKVLYKSGDLLLHLLEDLLSFSKNQIGQQLSLEEREFRLGDIRSQILTIFDKQVREGSIDFSVQFLGSDTDDNQGVGGNSMDMKLPAIGPSGIGRVKDMCLWGDQHRILQVLINLVSNSLKFTPAGGKVSVRMRCIGEVEHQNTDSRTSSFSRSGSNRPGRARHRVGSDSNHSSSSKGKPATPLPQYKGGTALSINPMEPKHMHVNFRERSPTPPPPNTKAFTFEFEVEDTGPGIPEHMQGKVFEPFVQGDLGLSKKFGGTGLGLSICQQLANLMGGTIALKSSVGVGTTFTMRIPLKYTQDRASSAASSSANSRSPSAASADSEGRRKSAKKVEDDAKASVLEQKPRLVGWSQPFFAATPNSGAKPYTEDQMKAVEAAAASKNEGRLRVLVADDNKTNVEVVTRMLKFEDVYDVTIAKDGQEAYDLVKADMENNLHFDLIFMDVQMPNLDGLQSTRLIRKMGYSAPIVALTAFSEESNVKECMECGMDEFLSKPIRRPALKQVLRRFATIPEEPETTSNHEQASSASKETPSRKVPSKAAGCKEGLPVNGVHPPADQKTS